MLYRALASLVLAAATATLAARGEDPDKTKPTPRPATDKQADAKKLDPKRAREQVAHAQEELYRRFRDQIDSLLRLAQRLEKGDGQGDKDHAALLRKALETSHMEKVDQRFCIMIKLLGKVGALTYADLREARDSSEEIRKVVQAMLATIAGDREADRKKARQELSELISKLKKVEEEQGRQSEMLRKMLKAEEVRLIEEYVDPPGPANGKP
jgi:iron-sulfur cluster repair protein YtfE (RIC family)